jgi:hypothetical protein
VEPILRQTRRRCNGQNYSRHVVPALESATRLRQPFEDPLIRHSSQGGILAALAAARRRGVYCEARKGLTESDPEMCQSIWGEGAGRTPEIEKCSTQSQDHVRRATQVEPSGTNTEDEGGSSHRVLVSGEPTWGERRWLRRVFRKDVVTAEYLDEWVATSRSPQRSRIWFTPVLPPEGSSSKPVMSYLPYNYPKSRRWSLEFCPAKPSGEPARLAMLANVFDPASIVYLQVSAKRILTKLEKWGSCVSQGGVGTSYKKRVAHDVLVPQPAFRASYRALKAKYKHWADDWPEKTDPQAFSPPSPLPGVGSFACLTLARFASGLAEVCF